MLDAFLTHLDTDLSERGRRVAPATIRATRSDLRAFSAWWYGLAYRLPFDPALVLATDLDDYLAQLQQAGRAPTIINRHAAPACARCSAGCSTPGGCPPMWRNVCRIAHSKKLPHAA